ncbi:sperm axonemal maintenance protein CFAP97D1-like isoform X2 [Erpetoichthys calabaricus]|uniref:sperm axonemal maintenance protein CFAP97D1-like isoform X2 n=1 Tax=Erpetoichthys calabaricus TaxID=27687 RepID=UPI002234B2F0|nr:sperm axonemal maintenance protein CFAP97D1-like isoform X2 [Erpetoichthys calabaricus]
MNNPNYLAYPGVLAAPGQYRSLSERWDTKYYEAHRDSVRKAKPMIDTQPPRKYIHSQVDLKKLQREHEKSAQIERENRILQNKLDTTKYSVDNWNNYRPRSLNYRKRVKELEKIIHENEAMMKRVEAQRTCYNRDKFEKGFRVTREHIARITKHPGLTIHQYEVPITSPKFPSVYASCCQQCAYLHQ